MFRKLGILAFAVAALAVGGCASNPTTPGKPGAAATTQPGGLAGFITGLQNATVALNNFNSALITLQITIVNNINAQAAQLKPLVCGQISLGDAMLKEPAVGKAVNAFLVQKVSVEAATSANEFQVAATDLCSAGSLTPTVTAVPPAATGG